MKKLFIVKIFTLLIIMVTLGFIGNKFYTTDKVQAPQNYSLVDMHGNPVDADSNDGKKQIIFFGYTFCPDVCPTTLQTVTTAFEKIKNPNEWVAVLVTIDPKRDTPAVLKEYITENFHKNITAYTGTENAIEDMAEAFQARYSVTEDTKGDEFYLMQHTAFIYFLNTNGSLSSISLYDISVDEMLRRMQETK